MLSVRTICHILLLQYELHLQDINNYVNVFMVQFGPRDIRHFSGDARVLTCCATRITSHQFTSEFSHAPQVYDNIELQQDRHHAH